jgi:hypothetical protein
MECFPEKSFPKAICPPEKHRRNGKYGRAAQTACEKREKQRRK